MIVLQFLAGIFCVLIVLGVIAWWASKDAKHLQSPHDPEKLQAERRAHDARTSVRGALAPMDDSEVEVSEARHRAWM